MRVSNLQTPWYENWKTNAAVAPSLRDTLRNVRQLLKPGGFLVVTELHTENIARLGTIFGAFPGWWVGAGEGRTRSPCVSPKEWDGLLRATGFSGCDTVTPVRNVHVMPMFVFVSQAVDTRVEFLRNPLSSTLSLFKDAATLGGQDLVLLGGCSSWTSKLITQLMSILRFQWRDSITVARSLDDIRSVAVKSTTTVLSILDLDEPVLANTSKSSWESLKWLLQEAGTIMWVSSGRRAKNPHANMMIGLLRVARLEHPALAFQSFDSESEQGVEAEELAEALLRLKGTVSWQRLAQADTLLQTIEPEIVREQDGTVVIPRVVESSELNDRYNSSRREIFSDVPDLSLIGNLGIVGSKLQNTKGDDRSTVHVTHSLHAVVRVSASHCAHLVLGQNSETNSQVIALTGQQSLKVVPYTQIPLTEPVKSGSESSLLALIAHHLVADLFLGGLAPGSSVVIHDSDAEFANVVANEAKSRGIEVVFTTTSTTGPVRSGWIAIHPKAPNRTLRCLLPTGLAALLDLNGDGQSEKFGSRLRLSLPRNCRYETIDSFLFLDAVWAPPNTLGPDAHTRLSDCVTRSLAYLTDLRSTDSTPTSNIAEYHLGSHIPRAVVNWTQLLSSAPVSVCPAESQVRFSDHKTYWLAGLSGGLGLLLCEWMVRHGAKYVVISSRVPRVDEAWLERMQAAGAQVKVYSWFVASSRIRSPK